MIPTPGGPGVGPFTGRNLVLGATLIVVLAAVAIILTLIPSADASADDVDPSAGAQRSGDMAALRRPGGDDAAASAAKPVPASIGSALLSPLSGTVSSTNERFAEAAASLSAAVPSPPDACPAPGAEFVDSWGAPRSGGRRHLGVDMMAPYGTPALAPVDGVVRGHHSGLGGLSYYLDGDDGNEYFGTHLQTMTASGRVSAGEPIGTVGSTGNAGTPHLHFEVKLGGVKSVNPYPIALALCS